MIWYLRLSKASAAAAAVICKLLNYLELVMCVIWTAWVFICAKFFCPHYHKHLAKFLQHPEKKPCIPFTFCSPCVYSFLQVSLIENFTLKPYSVGGKCCFHAMIRVVSDFSGSLQHFIKKQTKRSITRSKTKATNINIFLI